MRILFDLAEQKTVFPLRLTWRGQRLSGTRLCRAMLAAGVRARKNWARPGVEPRASFFTDGMTDTECALVEYELMRMRVVGR